MIAIENAKYRQGLLPGRIVTVDGDEICLEVGRTDRMRLLRILRDHARCQFKSLTDRTVVDYPNRALRFDLVYQLLSVRYAARLRVKVRVGEVSVVPSATSLFKSANWAEREVWDMFGVGFSGHPDLRRILTDYGFEGHPMRKEFPVEGYTQVRYDAEVKRVVCEPLELSQGPRPSQYRSAWKQVPSRALVTE
jgi:NADH dehydrogenase (ubiquinone) Fe-S protein 3